MFLAQGDGSISIVDEKDPGSRPVSPFCFIDDEYVDVPGGVVSVSDVLIAVFRFVIDQVTGRAAEVAVLSCPTQWGSRRQDVLRTACSRIVADTVIVPVAVAAAEIATRTAAPATPTQWVVLECGANSTTASYVVAGPDGHRVLESEHDPALDGAENLLDWAAQSVELGVRVRRDRGLGGVLVTGVGAASAHEAMRNAVIGSMAPNVHYRALSDGDVARGLGYCLGESFEEPKSISVPQANWLEPTLQESRGRGRGTSWPAVATVAAVLTVALVAMVVFALGEGDPAAGPRSAPEPSAVPAVPSSAPSDASSEPSSAKASGRAGEFEVGAVRIILPEGWHERTQSPVESQRSRVELVPGGGEDRRIIITQSRVREGAG
ncbi:MAG: type VII secretion-associated protein, partial [Rhodococcus sp. (in: high G+C Gram-positive bacteria)]|uniref:type VII secretion-associated protein n=1 Tax=Rhodococcus sp. TaxID=1831 RepID=UPI003BAE4DAA